MCWLSTELHLKGDMWPQYEACTYILFFKIQLLLHLKQANTIYIYIDCRTSATYVTYLSECNLVFRALRRVGEHTNPVFELVDRPPLVVRAIRGQSIGVAQEVGQRFCWRLFHPPHFLNTSTGAVLAQSLFSPHQGWKAGFA